jgi:chemotaxis protein CheX
MRAFLDEESVIKANSQFWEQMLAMTLEPLCSGVKFFVGAGHLFGAVSLAGAWTGRIELRMACALGYAATAAMMMQPLDTVAESDALDATKEIANMIAGTIKSSLPRPSTMTVPESAMESESFSCAGSTENSLMVAFRHDAGNLLVWICEQS